MEFDEFEFKLKIQEIEQKEINVSDLWGSLEGSYFNLERDGSNVKLVLNKKNMSMKKDSLFRQIETVFRNSGGQL